MRTDHAPTGSWAARIRRQTPTSRLPTIHSELSLTPFRCTTRICGQKCGVKARFKDRHRPSQHQHGIHLRPARNLRATEARYMLPRAGFPGPRRAKPAAKPARHRPGTGEYSGWAARNLLQRADSSASQRICLPRPVSAVGCSSGAPYWAASAIAPTVVTASLACAPAFGCTI